MEKDVKKEKVLYIGTADIYMVDIPLSLEKMCKYEVVSIMFPFLITDYKKDDLEMVEKKILEDRPDFVLSCDFSRTIAEACLRFGIPYISWVYDCPHETLYSAQAFYPTNYKFVFDKKQCERLKNLGQKNVYYMPLAIYPDRILAALSSDVDTRYNSDITFIGRLYYIDDNEKVIKCLSEYAKEKWGELADRVYMKWDYDHRLHGIMTKDFVELFDSINGGCSNKEAPYMSKQYKFEASVMGGYLAYRERTQILNALAKKSYHISFYTRDKKLDDLDSNIRILPGVDYKGFDIWRIYNQSKININISLHCIESGLSQRIFDVMASGGFMLSNYQQEIEELFEIGKEIVIYHDEKELLELVDYYLRHDEEREQIAKNGQLKVINTYTYENAFNRIMRTVSSAEFIRSNAELIAGEKEYSLKDVASKDVLYISTKEINLADIPFVLKKMECNVNCYEASFGIQDYTKEGLMECEKCIEGYNPDIVISCNFSRNISEICFKLRIPYIAWVYDCPQEDLYSVQAQYPSNYIFVFDKKQRERLKQIGISNVWHMPLAIYSDRIEAALSQVNEQGEYLHDIVFIGQSYYVEMQENLLKCFNDIGKIKWNEIVSKIFMHWTNTKDMYNSMSDDFISIFDQYNKNNSLYEYPYLEKKFAYETDVLSRHLAFRERIHILKQLSKNHNVAIYTNDSAFEILNDSAEVYPGIPYGGLEIFQIYNRSKININITLHCIESGIPQRVFDVLASGGFLITNYQREIEELFEIGNDLVVYHDEDELISLVDYYIQHEDERRRIAINGQKKVFQKHGYENRFKEIYRVVGENSVMDMGHLNELESKRSEVKEDYKVLCDELMRGDNPCNDLKYIKLWNKHDYDVNQYLASAYLDKGLWHEALETLKDIQQKDELITELISELESISDSNH